VVTSIYSNCKNVKQVHFIEPGKRPFKDSLTRFFKLFSEIRKHKKAALFLLAYFFYIDGVGTTISMAAVYGKDVGLDSTMLILAILMIQFVAFPFALIFGKLSERYSAKTVLLAGIGIYIVVTVTGFLLPSMETIFMKTVLFWIMSFLVATSMGGIQALSRSSFGKLIPAERSAEFYGLYNVLGRFAAIFGPLMMGIVATASGDSRWGVLSLVLLFVAGGLLLMKVDLSSED